MLHCICLSDDLSTVVNRTCDPIWFQVSARLQVTRMWWVIQVPSNICVFCPILGTLPWTPFSKYFYLFYFFGTPDVGPFSGLDPSTGKGSLLFFFHAKYSIHKPSINIIVPLGPVSDVMHIYCVIHILHWAALKNLTSQRGSPLPGISILSPLYN